MTKEIAEHLRKMTSRNGRYWLRDSRQMGDSQSAEELPFQSVSSSKRPHFSAKGVMHESIVVSIPDVAVSATSVAEQAVARSVQAVTPMAQSSTLPAKPADAASVPVARPIAPAIPNPPSAVPSDAPQTRVNISVPPLAPVVPQPQSFGLPAVGQPENSSGLEAKEVASDVATPFPLAKPEGKTTAATEELTPAQDDAVKAARATQSQETESSISKVADEILASFPAASPSVIMFAGSETSFHTDETCARVAAELAGRNLGRVLLIDSDFDGRRLTSASGMSKQGGLSEVMNIAYPWQDAILKSGSSKLDFMPAGSCPHKRWTPKKTLREALAEIRSSYQFVCICVGDAHSSAASTWSELSDGSLLVVSASQSSEAVAQSAVKELRGEGARLLGCILADANEM